jgi:hypothetical protein
MQGIVIQGPTSYWEQVIDGYKDFSNVVWSTWEDEPEGNIKNIQQHIPVIQVPKPKFPGYLNINLQCISTYAGAQYLQSLGVTEVLKTRGDVNITNLVPLMESLKGNQMSFLAICKEGVRTDIAYELGYFHNSHDYPTDQVIYGSIESIINTFDFQIEDHLPIPPEALVAYSYLTWRGEEFSLNFDYLKSIGVTFYMKNCLEHNVELYMVAPKHNFDLVTFHNSTKYYNF